MQSKDNKITTIPQFQSRSHPPKKNRASYSASLPQKHTKPAGFPFSSTTLKFQTSSAMKFRTFYIEHMWLLALLCRVQIGYLSVKNMSCLKKANISIFAVYIPSPYYFLFYFLQGLAHKDTKLGVITNVGKSRLVKSSLQNTHKMSDAWANSFHRYIMIVQCIF